MPTLPPRPDLLSPLQLAVLAWPGKLRPEEIGPGRTSLITVARVGSGTMEVIGTAFDAHQVRVEIVTGGEPGGGVATYRYRTDGATWSDPVLMPATGQTAPLLSTAPDALTEGADTGLRVAFSAGDPTPSFVALDRLDFSTKPVKKIAVACLAASAEAKSLICGEDGGGQFSGDLLAADDSILRYIAQLARLHLVEDRGIDPQSEDGKLYIGSAQTATTKLVEIGQKLRHPSVVEGGPEVAAPEVFLGNDRYRISLAYRTTRGRRVI